MSALVYMAPMFVECHHTIAGCDPCVCTLMEENKADRLLLEVIHWNYIGLLKARTRLPVSNHGGLT